MDINQIILGGLPAVAVLLCVLMCGGMMWMMGRGMMGRGMMSHGEQEKRRRKENDKRDPPAA
jgi:hypothetical protein